MTAILLVALGVLVTAVAALSAAAASLAAANRTLQASADQWKNAAWALGLGATIEDVNTAHSSSWISDGADKDWRDPWTTGAKSASL